MRSRKETVIRAVVTFALIGAFGVLALLLGGCSTDARVASHNIAKASEQFEINRRCVFYNGITGDYMLVVEGRLSIEYDAPDNQLEVTCKTGPGEFKKHTLGLSDNISYFVEQLDAAAVDAYHYRVIFKPESIIPNVDMVTD